MASVGTPPLYIAHDDQRIVVSAFPLDVAGGNADTYLWGSVVEITPSDVHVVATPARNVRGYGVLLVLVGLVITWCGAEWGYAVAAVGVAVFLAGLVKGDQDQMHGISAPQLESHPDEHRVLVDQVERKVFSEALDLGQRASRSWPALGGLVDVPAAETLLARALHDLAGVLERRQELRNLRTELVETIDQHLPTNGSAARELSSRQKRVKQALVALDDEVARRITSLAAIATAGEDFVREQQVGRLALRVDDALARLAPSDLLNSQDAAAELADQTKAVLSAYRELNDRYGDGNAGG